MTDKIFFAQTISELKFILNKVDEPMMCVPLSLQTQVYCIRNKLKFYNPIDFITNEFYENVLIESENLINKLEYGDLKLESQKKEYRAIILCRFFSVAFLMEIIKKINDFKKIDKIFLSGWNNYLETFSLLEKNHFISNVIINLIKDINIIKLSNNDDEKISSRKEKKYLIFNKNLKKDKKYILANTLGYNLTRVLLRLSRKGYHVLIPSFKSSSREGEIGFIKKIIFKLLKITVVEFDSDLTNIERKISLPDIKFSYENKNLSTILNLRKEQEMGNLINMINMYKGIDILFEKFNFKLVLTNLTKGAGGYYIEKSNEKNIRPCKGGSKRREN